MPRIVRCAACLPFLLCAHSALRALTIIPPVNLLELARDSDGVMVARATASEVGGEEFFTTRTTFLIERGIRGDLPAGKEVVVETPGGLKGDILCVVPGMPAFEIGSSYFMCLSKTPGGAWVPRMAAYGVLKEVAGEDGLPTLSPLPQARFSVISRPDGATVEPIASYRSAELVSHLATCLAGAEGWSSAKVLTLAPRLLPVIPAGCSYFFVSGGGTTYYFRWFEFDEGGSISMAADQSNDAQVDALSLIPGAISAWNVAGNPDGLIRINYGGAVPITSNCQSADAFTREGRVNNTIVFNDPCNIIPDLTIQGGVVANGGIRVDLGQGITARAFGGDGCRLWARVLGWQMLVNNNVWGGFGLSSLTQYQQVLTHELGHGLAFDHVSDPEAMMHSICCNDINATDRTCAVFAYPRPRPGIEVSATSLDFGTVTTGTQKALSFRVRSVGNVNLHVSGFGIDTGTLGGFSMTSPSSATVSPCVEDPSFEIQVRFTPAAVGEDSGAVILTSNDMASSPTVVSLSGEGVAPLVPDIDAGSSPLQFGDVRTGTDVSRALSIRNVGQASLNVSSVSLVASAPAFSLSGSPGGNLLPNGTLELNVTFAPLSMGLSLGTIRIESNDPDEPRVDIALRGTGIQPQIQVSPAVIDFSDVVLGSTRNLGVSVKNAGTYDLTVLSVALEPGSSDAFSYTGTSSFTLTPGKSEPVGSRFSPDAVGPVGAALLIDSNDPVTPRVRVPLSGRGQSAPGGSRLPGDCNEDGMIDISDPICVLGFLFLGQPTELPCGTPGTPEPDPSDIALVDWNGDGQLDLSDPVASLTYSFGGGFPHALDPDGQGTTCLMIADCTSRCGG